MVGNARVTENLIAAGLTLPLCRGVLALTNDDHANLSVAISVRLLNPAVPVLARAMSRDTTANLISFGADHVINPFATFGEHLTVAIRWPGSHRLITWLAGLPGTTLRPETAPPSGRWIVRGYRRFGSEVVRAFRGQDLDVTIIEPDEGDLDGLRVVRGVGTEAGTLEQAASTPRWVSSRAPTTTCRTCRSPSPHASSMLASLPSCARTFAPITRCSTLTTPTSPWSQRDHCKPVSIAAADASARRVSRGCETQGRRVGGSRD